MPRNAHGTLEFLLVSIEHSLLVARRHFRMGQTVAVASEIYVDCSAIISTTAAICPYTCVWRVASSIEVYGPTATSVDVTVPVLRVLRSRGAPRSCRSHLRTLRPDHPPLNSSHPASPRDRHRPRPSPCTPRDRDRDGTHPPPGTPPDLASAARSPNVSFTRPAGRARGARRRCGRESGARYDTAHATGHRASSTPRRPVHRRVDVQRPGHLVKDICGTRACERDVSSSPAKWRASVALVHVQVDDRHPANALFHS